MVSFRQLEAIYWVTRLEGFAAAAQHLHTSQSAISKRIKELERQFDTPLFDRSSRSAKLTARGMRMYRLAQHLLQQREAALEQFIQADLLESHVRIGVTELIAMTWLPRLIRAVQQQYPRVVIECDVDSSTNLKDKLDADALDLMVVPEVFDGTDITHLSVIPVGKAEMSWMCKPGTVGGRKTLRLDQLATHRLLIQGLTAGTGLVYKRWLANNGVRPTNLIVCNNLVGRISLTISGLGVSYLPRGCAGPLLASGALQIVNATPVLPPTRYVACHKRERRSNLVASIVQLTKENCDFAGIAGLDSRFAGKVAKTPADLEN